MDGPLDNLIHRDYLFSPLFRNEWLDPLALKEKGKKGERIKKTVLIAYNNFINCPTDSGDCKQVIVVAHPVVANAREREEEECDDDPIIKIHISALFDLQLSSIVENLTETKIKIKLISTMHVLSLSQSHPFAGWTLFVIFSLFCSGTKI